ncbi:MAG TPA: hypothetical protein VHE34_13575 [Puia sp.]|uniref:hypothetical protein n=1 Tax=Puia sp. TaxID=2045100 RepID=UPI002C0BB24F|nr:hypothetical protein [Puia sp.]HVU96253.1 hypothetical protein [Puia sp.]
MKYRVAAFLLFFSFAGCSKSNNNSPSGSFSATIGPTSYQGTTTLGAYSYGLGELAIVSYSQRTNDTSAFQVTMPWPAKAFNQVLPADTLLTLSYTAKGTEYDAWSTEDQLQLTITSIDSIGHKIAGSFTATGHSAANFNDSVVITNGKFSTSYNVNP